jgi:hypothetical protein
MYITIVKIEICYNGEVTFVMSIKRACLSKSVKRILVLCFQHSDMALVKTNFIFLGKRTHV